MVGLSVSIVISGEAPGGQSSIGEGWFHMIEVEMVKMLLQDLKYYKVCNKKDESDYKS